MSIELRPCGCPIDSFHREGNPLCQRVIVTQGRWKGRVGVVVDEHRNWGSPGGQQMQFFPIVRLDPRGRAKARRVTVLAIEPA